MPAPQQITISAANFRTQMADLMNGVKYRGDVIIVQKYKKPFVLIISPEEYEELITLREAAKNAPEPSKGN